MTSNQPGSRKSPHTQTDGCKMRKKQAEFKTLLQIIVSNFYF